MINHIEGVVQPMSQQEITVLVGPFGLSLQVPNSALFQPGKKAKIFAHMHWNQEQGPSLFGFATATERAVFLLVTSCSGIGPKIALAVLSDIGPQAFIEAIQQGNDSALSKVSGIGAKKAEQIVVQLKHKVAKLIKSGIDLGGSGSFEQWNNISDVLESLSYSRVEINAAMNHLREERVGAHASFDQLMRNALSFLAKKA